MLTRVGESTSPASFGASAGATIHPFFTPDTTWQEGDVLILPVSAADAYPGSGFSYAAILSATAGWDLQISLEDNTNDGYWFFLMHEVTAGEAGAGIITCALTLLQGVNGYIQVGGGVAIRGADASTVQVFSDDDSGEVSIGSASGSVGTFANVAPYAVGTGGTVLMYIHGQLSPTALTAASHVWSATELNDSFQQNAMGTRDAAWSSAYRLTVAENWPADTTTVTYTGTGAGSSAWRFALIFARPPISQTFEVLSSVATIDHDVVIGQEPDQHHAERHDLSSELEHSGGFMYKSGAHPQYFTDSDVTTYETPGGAQDGQVSVTYDTLNSVTLIWTRIDGVWVSAEASG